MSAVPHVVRARAKVGEVGGSEVDAAKSAEHSTNRPMDTCVQRSPVTVSALARSLGVAARTVREWCEQGKLVATRTLGGHWRIPRDEAERLLSGRAQTA